VFICVQFFVFSFLSINNFSLRPLRLCVRISFFSVRFYEAKLVAASRCRWNAFMGTVPRQSKRLLYPASLVLLCNTHLPGLSSSKSKKIYLGVDISNHGRGLQSDI